MARDYFRGKVALVSGASRGVGLALARQLVQSGAKVVMTARGEKRLLASEQELKSLGGDVAALAGDVGKWEDAERMVRLAMEKFGRLDILVNNAGVSMRGHFSELAPEVCKQVAETNLMGSIYLSRAAIPFLKAAKGHLVFISSIAGLFGLPGASIYCASKGGLKGLTESLRLELAAEGVHVGIVYLGYTEHDPEKRILLADGKLAPPDRPAHHSQAYAAGLILKLIEKRKRDLVMTPIGKLGAYIYRFFPGLVEQAVLFAQSRNLSIYRRFS
jgi:NAD(P)-dependent dehydrogenase (short-subunit alcohol dehydrogenase family)